MARRGGQVTGIDPTPKQLETARRLEREHGLGVELIEAFGEELPFPDSTFDFRFIGSTSIVPGLCSLKTS